MKEKEGFCKGKNLPLAMSSTSVPYYSAMWLRGQEIQRDMFSATVWSVHFTAHSAKCNAGFFLWIFSFVRHGYK